MLSVPARSRCHTPPYVGILTSIYRLFAAWHERPNAGAHRKGLCRHGRNRELRWKAAPSGLPSVLRCASFSPGKPSGTTVAVTSVRLLYVRSPLLCRIRTAVSNVKRCGIKTQQDLPFVSILFRTKYACSRTKRIRVTSAPEAE